LSFKKAFSNFLETHKRERNGLAVLACLMIGTILFLTYLAFIYEADFSQERAEMLKNYNAYKEELAQRKLSEEIALQSEPESKSKSTHKITPEKKLFHFDPNTVTDSEWKKLGLNSGQIKTINNYKQKGGKYYKPEDLGKMYTISDKQYQELLPFISIEKPKSEKKNWKSKDSFVGEKENHKPNFYDKVKERTPLFIDINTADTTELKKLKGIGSFYAKKIVEERIKLGGYHDISQLLEIWNFTPEMLAKITSEIHLGDSPLKTININNCEIEELAKNPYLNWKQANSIVKYRIQHGPYKSVLDIQKSHLISEELCQKIKPYLTIE
jgi:DNA uptake protein ComE-like DNA-binding protein